MKKECKNLIFWFNITPKTCFQNPRGRSVFTHFFEEMLQKQGIPIGTLIFYGMFLDHSVIGNFLKVQNWLHLPVGVTFSDFYDFQRVNF